MAIINLHGDDCAGWTRHTVAQVILARHGYILWSMFCLLVAKNCKVNIPSQNKCLQAVTTQVAVSKAATIINHKRHNLVPGMGRTIETDRAVAVVLFNLEIVPCYFCSHAVGGFFAESEECLR